ncbi:MAG: hypothetical protein ACOYM7_01625, partial [Paludibacter sp.]
MKRFLFLSILIVVIMCAKAQITATGTCKMYDKMSGIDYLLVFDGINSQSAIIFNGANADKVKWYRFDNQTTP